MTYTVVIMPSAMGDLVDAKKFYGHVDSDLGKYCTDSLLLEAERLAFFAGIHSQTFGYYRVVARNFPFSIYYKISNEYVLVSAFIDNRKQPETIRNKLVSL